MQASRLKPALAAVMLAASAPSAAGAACGFTPERRVARRHARHEDTAMLRRMVAIAGVWFGVLALVMVLSAPDAPPARPMQASAEAPPAAQPELPRTRALRHGGSGTVLPPPP